MLKTDEIQIRDPFVLPVAKERKYYLYGTTDKNAWGGKATGFDGYVSSDLENWEGPFAAFRPEAEFWADENFWAPEVYLYNGDYYMFASFKTEGKCRGTQILCAKSPFGPFLPHSEGPVTPDEWECLDGTLYVDENQEPWMVFCHEWLQVDDGEMCAIRLTKDMEKSAGEPILLFHASDAPWTHHHAWNDTEQKKQYVTDGPFLFISPEGRLNMLWSSYTQQGYAIGLARSITNSINGPWEHIPEPFYSRDGGHGMLFKTFDGQFKLTIHTPNITPNERAIFINVNLSDSDLKVIKGGK